MIHIKYPNSKFGPRMRCLGSITVLMSLHIQDGSQGMNENEPNHRVNSGTQLRCAPLGAGYAGR